MTMREYEILARGLFCPDQLIITYHPSLRMPTSPAIQQWMDTFWAQKLAEAQERSIPLFDAPLYRFVDVEARADNLYVILGDTGYKEYVTTRAPEFSAGRKRQELGNALAVCSVVETSDDYILLDKRRGVDVYVGRYHVIGGFFERDLDRLENGQPDPFGAIRREIREETGIQPADIAEQYCLGLVYDLATPHAELCFLTRLHIPLSKVKTRIPEENEIKQLETLYVTKQSLRDFIKRNHGNISATGEPNLLLYGELRFGGDWLLALYHTIGEVSFPERKGKVDMTMTSDRLPMVMRADWIPGPAQGHWTYEEYAALPDDGKRYEIVSGVLYMLPSPSGQHQDAALEIASYLRAHVKLTGLGLVRMAPFDVILPTGDVVQPDVLVVLNEHLDRVTDKFILGAPDLVVEIASPSTATHDRHNKLDAYARSGVPEYWIVDPFSHTVEVLSLERVGMYQSLGLFSGKATLPSLVIPDFSPRVEQFFM